MAIFIKTIIELNFQRGNWARGFSWCFSFAFNQIPAFPKVLSRKSYSRNCWRHLLCRFSLYIQLMLCLWFQPVLNLRIFPMFFANDFLKNFHVEVLGFSSLKLSAIDHCTTVKSSICWCFCPRSPLNQVKSLFST